MKQADPAPLAGSSAHPNDEVHIGKRKAALIAKSAREGTAATSARARKKAASQPERDARGKRLDGFASGRGDATLPRKKKKVKRTSQGGKGADDEDDIEGLEQEDDYSDSDGVADDDEGGKDYGLEAARAYV